MINKELCDRLQEALELWQARAGQRRGRTPSALATELRRLNAAREEQGLPPLQGATPQTMLRYFAGEDVPRADTLVAMAEIMGAAACYLLTGEGSLEPTPGGERALHLIDDARAAAEGGEQLPDVAARPAIRAAFYSELLHPERGMPDFEKLVGPVRTLFTNLWARRMARARDHAEYPEKGDDAFERARHRGRIAGALARAMMDHARERGWHGHADSSPATTAYMVAAVGKLMIQYNPTERDDG